MTTSKWTIKRNKTEEKGGDWRKINPSSPFLLSRFVIRKEREIAILCPPPNFFSSDRGNTMGVAFHFFLSLGGENVGSEDKRRDDETKTAFGVSSPLPPPSSFSPSKLDNPIRSGEGKEEEEEEM